MNEAPVTSPVPTYNNAVIRNGFLYTVTDIANLVSAGVLEVERARKWLSLDEED